MNAVLLAAVLLSAAPAPPESGAEDAAPPDDPPQSMERLTEPQQLSYALGVNIGRSLLADGLDPDPQLFLDGLRDALTDRPVRLSDERIAALLNDAARHVRTSEAAAAEKRAAASRTAFEALAKQPETKTFSTGEALRFDKTGDGPKPGPESVLRLHYESRIAGEDEPFFSTRPPAPEDGDGNEAGPQAQTVTVPLAKLLPGLRTVLTDVPAGSKVTIGLPPDRAYGPTGGPGVPPNAALFITVELLDVLPAPTAGGEGENASGETP